MRQRLCGWLVAVALVAASGCFSRVMEDKAALALTLVLLWSWAGIEVFAAEVV